MLALLSVISLVVGAFVAGGGAFDWEFLFSDGYREHDWVRNLGRAGARGLLMLLGGVLVVVGFVGQVVDNAAQPVVVTANTQETFETPDQSPPPTGGSGAPSTTTTQTGHPAPVKGPVSPRTAAGPQTSQSTAASPPPAAGEDQPITIWNPQLEFGEEETMIRLQYRFEPGYEPVPGAEYIWQLEVPDKRTEVAYGILPAGGQLEYILRLPQPAKTFSEAWSTRLMVEHNGKRTPVSNRLDIARGQVRSTPLEAPPP